MRSPWPRGLRIHRRNDPLAALPDSHPAKRLLIAHAECWRDCAGWDVGGPGKDSIDQEWDSEIESRRKTFSGLVYEYVCFDLVLEPWPEKTDFEKCFRARIGRLRRLLDECEHAAIRDRNDRIVDMVNQVRRYSDLWEGVKRTGAYTE